MCKSTTCFVIGAVWVLLGLGGLILVTTILRTAPFIGGYQGLAYAFFVASAGGWITLGFAEAIEESEEVG